MHLSGVRPSVCLSVRPPVRPFVRFFHPAAARRCCGDLLLWARQPADIERLLHDRRAGGQQQPRRSTARRMRAVPRCQPSQEAEDRLV